MSAVSSKETFAEPMLDREDFLEDYKKKLKELMRKGQLPDLSSKQKYKVYSIRGNEFGAHKSIVLSADDEKFFTVELGFIVVDGQKHIYPVTKSLDKSLKAKMQYLGEIEETGQRLIGKAVAVMKQFGSYFKLCNNCQDYCNKYIGAIGLENAQTLTDAHTAGIAFALMAILAYLFTSMRN